MLRIGRIYTVPVQLSVSDSMIPKPFWLHMWWYYMTEVYLYSVFTPVLWSIIAIYMAHWAEKVLVFILRSFHLLLFSSARDRSLYSRCCSSLSPQLPLSHCQHNQRELLPAILFPWQRGVQGGPGVYQHRKGRMQPHNTDRTSTVLFIRELHRYIW